MPGSSASGSFSIRRIKLRPVTYTEPSGKPSRLNQECCLIGAPSIYFNRRGGGTLELLLQLEQFANRPMLLRHAVENQAKIPPPPSVLLNCLSAATATA